VSENLLHSISQFLYREAELVDAKDWEGWLALFSEDVEYHVPSWDSDEVYTNNPDTEMSLIFYRGRFGLEDRIYRLKTNTSSASIPPPRTCHFVTNIRVEQLADGDCGAKANWQVNLFREHETTSFYGYYEYVLRPNSESWLIAKKKIIVLNDTIPTVLDIYSI
jgi:anthranilate 1,2-dioxygenase small subunit